MTELQKFLRKLSIWDKSASIRTRPRKILKDYNSDCRIFYPMSHQPIVFHPLVTARGQKTVEDILIHSAYKFSQSIAKVEMECIIDFCNRLYSQQLVFDFPYAITHDVLSIIIDEVYHAYVAVDFMSQVQELTTIQPLIYQSEAELSHAVKKTMAKCPDQLKEYFEIIAICIGENTLTNELYDMKRIEGVHPYFVDIMADHMIDEGKHCSKFIEILTYTWAKIDPHDQNKIIDLLPDFIADYVSSDLTLHTSNVILDAVGFTPSETDIIVRDTYSSIKGNKQILVHNPMVQNILKVLARTGVTTSEYAKDCFSSLGWLHKDSVQL